jgi:hypothetical protein
MTAILAVSLNLDAEPVDVLGRMTRLQAAREEAERLSEGSGRPLRIAYGTTQDDRHLTLYVAGHAARLGDVLGTLGKRGYLGFFVVVNTSAERAAITERADHLSVAVDPEAVLPAGLY